MKRFIGAILLLGASQAAFAGIYEMTFRRVTDASDPEGCRAFTEKAAYELTQQSGAHVISSGCRADDYTLKGLDSVLTYQSATRLYVTSTATTSVYSGAFYSKLETCNQRLELQKQLFTRATGLKPLTAYCTLDIGSPGQWWETRVDGLGKSTMQAYAAAVTVWGELLDGKAVFQSYLDSAPGYGISIFEVGLQNSGMGSHVVVRLYADEPYHLQDYDEMKYENAADCAYAATAVKTALQAAAKPVVSFCEKDRVTKKMILHVTSFSAILKPVDVFRAYVLAAQYPTLSACQNATESVVGDAHDDVFGAVCAGTGKDFRIHLFGRP